MPGWGNQSGEPDDQAARKYMKFHYLDEVLYAEATQEALPATRAWWRLPIHEWPRHTYQYPPHPDTVRGVVTPSGWICRCGRNDMEWRHREPPHIDATGRQCCELIVADGTPWITWCIKVRSE